MTEIVCLCGSTKFKDQFIAENKRLTLEGKIVLSVGMFGHHENLDMNSDTKVDLDKLHLEKIALSSSIFVINVGGYIGKSTMREIAFADSIAKQIDFLEPENAFIPSCLSCQHYRCALDMDPWCENPKILPQYPYGVSINGSFCTPKNEYLYERVTKNENKIQTPKI